MGTYYTRIIRVYKKSSSQKMNASEICNSLANTANLDGQIYCYENNQDNCLDIKFSSEEVSGDLNLDSKFFDVWEIRDSDILFNGKILNRNLNFEEIKFSFDEIHFDSDNTIINQAYFGQFAQLKVQGKFLT